MWKHYCKAEKGWVVVERGKQCNWCDVEEPLEEQEGQPVSPV
jgi:hypothetical protein